MYQQKSPLLLQWSHFTESQTLNMCVDRERERESCARRICMQTYSFLFFLFLLIESCCTQSEDRHIITTTTKRKRAAHFVPIHTQLQYRLYISFPIPIFTVCRVIIISLSSLFTVLCWKLSSPWIVLLNTVLVCLFLLFSHPTSLSFTFLDSNTSCTHSHSDLHTLCNNC